MKSTYRQFTTILSILFVAVFSCYAEEGSLYPVSLQEKYDSSTLIIEGKVIRRESFWNSEEKMIYTNNSIAVFNVIKGNLSTDTIIIQTVGGQVGNTIVTTSSLLSLDIGEQGVFFCNPNQTSESYSVYASSQGFIRFYENQAFCPFFQASVKDFELQLNQLLPTPFNFQEPEETLLQNIAFLPEPVQFYPSLITAGTGSLLTVKGAGFGTTGPDTSNYVAFKDANNGGAAYYTTPEALYVSWSDTMIVLKVPTRAGSGPIRVVKSGIAHTTSSSIYIPYALLTANDTAQLNLTDLNNAGGVTWRLCSNMNFANGPIAPLTRAMNTWKCATGVNWQLSGTYTSIEDAAMDGINVIARNDNLSAGVLGVCYRFYTHCNDTDWYITDQDILFKKYFFSIQSWNYDIAAPGTNSYDFESVALHELGHAHLQGHVIDTANVLNWATGTASMHRVLLPENIAGGNHALDLNLNPFSCSVNLMTRVYPAGCSASNSTDIWLYEANNQLTDNICFGTHPIQFSFFNLGLDTIQQANFGWRINGITQPTFSWTGSVPFIQNESNITLAGYNFQDSTYTISIWAVSVNGISELNTSNDTLTFVFHPQPCTPDNLKAVSIDTFDVNQCLANEDVKVNIANVGTNDITSFQAITFVNGLPFDTIQWVGLLQSGDTLQHFVTTNVPVFSPTIDLKIVVELPNGIADSYTQNDTCYLTMLPNKLLGTYTVGGSNPHFATLTEALTQLDQYGVCGNVTFNLRSGVYPISYGMIDIPAGNFPYEIVFQAESGNPEDVIIQKINANSNWDFRLAHNLTFRNLTFYDWQLKMIGCKNTTWENNHFLETQIHIYVGMQGASSHNQRFVGNLFHNSYLYTTDFPYDSIANGLTITGNRFEGINEGGYIEIDGYKNITINNNYLLVNYETYSENLHVSHLGDSLNIFNNILESHNKSSGLLYIFTPSIIANDTIPVFIYNNQITHIYETSSSSNKSITIYGTNKVYFTNNSVYFKCANYSPSIYYRVAQIGAIDSCILQNNQLVNDGFGPIFDLSNNEAFLSDYNNYWTNGSFTTNQTYSQFTASNASDSHSTFIDPLFASPQYLYPTNAIPLDNLGTPVPFVATDLSNAVRNPVTPDVGAYEFRRLQLDLQLMSYNNLDTSFCSGGNADLYLNVYNNGLDTITSFSVSVKLDGVTIDTLLVNQVIAPQQTINFFAGNYVFTDAVTTVEAFVFEPNGQIDSMAYNNDYTFNFYTQLAGEYTVGDSLSDFVNIQEALHALHLGICGPVVFNLKDGYHDNWGTIGHIANNNSTNTITFQSLSHDSAAVIVSANTNTLKLKGPKYLTFRNIKFASHNTFPNSDITLDTAYYLTFDSCHFSGSDLVQTYNGLADSCRINQSGFHTSNITLKQRVFDLIITESHFSGNSILNVNGVSTNSVHPVGITLKRNEFNCAGNPVEIYFCEKVMISENKIKSTTTALKLGGMNLDTSYVINNFLSGQWQALDLADNLQVRILNNSMLCNGIKISSASQSVIFKNNILQIMAPSAQAFMFADNAVLSSFKSDHNIFNVASNDFGYITSSQLFFNYPAWRNLYLKDSNSYSANPNFFYPNLAPFPDLHVNSLTADGHGLNLPEVTIDIDGETRDSQNPDIGADEFSFNTATVFDLQLDSLVEPNNSTCLPADSVIVWLQNNYSQDLTSATFRISFNNGPQQQINWTGYLPMNQSMAVPLTNFNVVPGNTTQIVVSVSAPNGQTDWNTLNDTVYSAFTAYGPVSIVSDPAVICGGQDVQLTVTPTLLPPNWNTGNSSDTLTVNTAGNYWADLVDPFGCHFSDSMELFAFPAATPVSISATDSVFCEGEFVSLSATPQLAGNSYLWSYQSQVTPAISVTSGGIIQLITTNSNGCSTIDSIALEMLPLPNSNFFLVNDSILQSAETNAASYQWCLDGIPIPGANSSEYIVQTDGDYSLIITNMEGCTDTSASVTVIVSNLNVNTTLKPVISFFPNPFSDELSIIFSDEPKHIMLLDVTGRLVYEITPDEKMSVLNLSNLSTGMYYLKIDSLLSVYTISKY